MHAPADIALPAVQQQKPAAAGASGDEDSVGSDVDTGAGEGERMKRKQRWQWWRFDDQDVSALNPKAALQEQGADGYLLFFVCDPVS